MIVDSRRVRILRQSGGRPGPIVYWMSRDQRVRDNWALAYAQELAIASRQPLVVAFCLVPGLRNRYARHYDFMIRGLRETESALRALHIPFVLRVGRPGTEIPALAAHINAGAVVTDFSPLRTARAWKRAVAARLSIPFYEVDAHNIIPCWIASPKQEYGAYTLRPKINKLLPEFLTPLPRPREHLFRMKKIPAGATWRDAVASLRVDPSVPPVGRPGEAAANAALRSFLTRGLSHYHEARNDPNAAGQSGLSAYLHFGQLSAQRIALSVSKADAPRGAREAFLEELIVRRELSDNFCFYNSRYDSPAGFPDWARKTLREHANDHRTYRYTLAHFENRATHDLLWNAAQAQMAETGRMHGYMRMYWAKKILEWTTSAAVAMRIAIALNDKYELDGRDPNGYAGIAWSLGGVHDRPWFTRPIYGQIRYMSASGLSKKFDTESYIRRYGS